MLTILNQPHKLMTPEKAEALAATLNKEGDSCEYRAMHDPKGTGFSYVAVIEDGEIVLKL